MLLEQVQGFSALRRANREAAQPRVTDTIKPNVKQKEALTLVTTNRKADNILFVGGSRSGKTFWTVYMIMVRAWKYPRSRHLICRLRFSHAKASIWLDTLPKVLRLMGLEPKRDYVMNKTNYYIVFKHNQSEVWIDGLDNAERVEKMLGREYNTIYYNECSQIAYDTVTTVNSRLALRSVSPLYGECRNLLFYDCNPPNKSHWTYKLWFLHVNPEDKKVLPKEEQEKYASLKMNPVDNIDNVGSGYIKMLNSLPERKKKRFLEGEYSDVEGAIFDNFDLVHEVPLYIRQNAIRTIGVDFGFSNDPAAAVQLWFVRKREGRSKLYIEQLVYNTELKNKQLAKAIWRAVLAAEKKAEYLVYRENGGEYDFAQWEEEGNFTGVVEQIPVYCDNAEPKSRFELEDAFKEMQAPLNPLPAAKGKDSVNAGIAWMQELDIYVVETAQDVIMEMESYEWVKDNEGRSTTEPSPKDNHAIDATRYGCSTYIGQRGATTIDLQ